MAKSSGSKGPRRAAGSFFANLPQDLKSQLRSQSFPDKPTSTTETPEQVDIVPSVPASKRRKISNDDTPSTLTTLIPTQPDDDEDLDDSQESAGENSKWDCTGLVPRYTHHSEMPKNIQKYFYQRNELFSRYATHNILMDETGWFSVTPESIACHIAERCQSDTILDAFCGVGGNAIQFAMTCERVIAIDNDMTRLKLARHNAMQYGVADRIEFICGDYIAFAESYARRLDEDRRVGRPRHGDEIDVVFLSPPWGGTDYLHLGKSTTASTESPRPPSNKGKQRDTGGLDDLGESTGAESASTSRRTEPKETFGIPNEMPPYPLSALAPIPGDQLFRLTSRISPNIAFYLPKNTDTNELAALAPDIVDEEGNVVGKEWVEVEEEFVGKEKGWNSLKAITAYYGGIVAAEE